ncbi:hypothetical protein AST15_04015 [Staphylococcus shinii]|nr:hypothetical protein AST15_04015 [Staphylococcus shinii]
MNNNNQLITLSKNGKSKLRGVNMKILNYSIEHDVFSELVTIVAETTKGKQFSFTFSDSHTLKEVKIKLEELADTLDNNK